LVLCCLSRNWEESVRCTDDGCCHPDQMKKTTFMVVFFIWSESQK
jgi:hypothetical protein